MLNVVRTQIQLTERQAARLKRIAAERGISMAAVIREAVDAVVEREGAPDPRARALSVVGTFGSGVRDLAREHDRYLDEAYDS
jgi:Ribbon-helix-helix protein, copG family